MKWISTATSVIFTLILLSAPVMAADAAKYGTKEDAIALANKAAALYKQDATKAIETFNNPQGGFVDRDLYVTITKDDGTLIVHGTKPVLIGKNTLSMKDVEGFEFAKAFLAVKDTGFVKYKWPDTNDAGKIKEKTAYVLRVPDGIMTVGYYEKP